ncbi:mitochondrial inner membrane protein OXA1-like [Lolium perenne]|uniref:mitochondrial inner membrane protein OXA1-like n=1 Tax=Lolium perenne TaxID=4522 RepID=UPI0021F5E9CA|nr:mitochondrial inner membrane protein OXA1-like [Lolium perenne]
MAFAARRSLACGLSRHLARRLHPSLPHLVPSHHDRSGDPSCSSPPPPPPTHHPSWFPSGDLRRNLTLPLPFGAHRNFSSGPEVDTVLSDAASSVLPAPPFPGEVAAAAAADSFPPFAAAQHLIDAVHSFTGLNWWASIALTTVLVRAATIPLLVRQFKAERTINALKPEVKAIEEDMLNSTDPRAKQERNKKLSELYRKHGVSRLTPYNLLFIQGPIFISFSCAISNMIEKVPSFKEGGAFWFTDLTTPDELYILPVLISMAFAADEINIKASRSPIRQNIKIANRVLAVSIVPLSMSFCKAHFFYWVPWTLFSLACRFAFRNPAVRQYMNIPPVVPRHVPAVQVSTSKGPKPIPTFDSSPAVNGSEQSSSEPRDKSVDVEKKRRTPSVITIRVRE